MTYTTTTVAKETLTTLSDAVAGLEPLGYNDNEQQGLLLTMIV